MGRGVGGRRKGEAARGLSTPGGKGKFPEVGGRRPGPRPAGKPLKGEAAQGY